MPDAKMIEIWRGGRIECVHRGHAVVCDAAGQIVHQYGDPHSITFPRSSAKMIQALPLIETGAAAAHSLSTAQLALACSSHISARYHIDPIDAWMTTLGLSDDAYHCGPQEPRDLSVRDQLIRDGQSPCRIHNNCSGKHAGFLTVAQHLGAGPDYLAMDHPVQQGILAAFEDVTNETSPGFGIDGCSAPNHACTLHGLARAMAQFASARDRADSRAQAMVALTDAMMAHPELISGNDKACTDLMRAADGRAAIKTGADGVYIAILPELGLGVALKITDGAQRASEPAIATILNRLGVIQDGHPALARHMTPAVKNFAGLVTGEVRPTADFAAAF